MAKLEVQSVGTRTQLKIDGYDVSNAVTGMTLKARAGGVAWVSMSMAFMGGVGVVKDDVVLMVNEVQIPPALEDALYEYLVDKRRFAQSEETVVHHPIGQAEPTLLKTSPGKIGESA